MRQPVLVLVAMAPGLSGLRCVVGGSADTPTWYQDEYEYNYTEMLVLVVLVVLAILFESFWHHMMHSSEGSYKFGRIESFINHAHHPSPFGGVKNQQLFRELVNRAGGEFMTLGFLAACVYFFRQGGGFDWLAAHSSKDTWPYPKSGYDWLHMAEDVHLKLFFAMVFYFILTARLVSGAVYQIRLWEHVRLKRILPNFEDTPSVEHLKVSDALCAEHAALRRYFMFKMVRWQQKRPKVFRRLIHELQLNEGDWDFDIKFYELLDNDFSFSAYLAVSIESGVRDSIQVHISTWFVLLVTLLLFALLNRTCHMDLLNMMPTLVALTMGCIIVMRLLVRRVRKQIADRIALEESVGLQASRSSTSSFAGAMMTLSSARQGDEGGCHGCRQLRRWFREAHRTEYLVLRFLQTVLFLISYLCSRILLNFQDWKARPDQSLFYLGLFFLLFIALAIEVPRSVPLFLGITSLPPYMDREQFRLFGAVLLQGREASYQKDMADLKAKLLHGGTGDLNDRADDDEEAPGDMSVMDDSPVGTDDLEDCVRRSASIGSSKSGRSRRAPNPRDQEGEFFRTFIALARQRGLDCDEVMQGISLHLRGGFGCGPRFSRPSPEQPSPHEGVGDGPASPSLTPRSPGRDELDGAKGAAKGSGSRAETPETASLRAGHDGDRWPGHAVMVEGEEVFV